MYGFTHLNISVPVKRSVARQLPARFLSEALVAAAAAIEPIILSYTETTPYRGPYSTERHGGGKSPVR